MTNSSVTTSRIEPIGMIAKKLTAKVATGLWFVYLTANPVGMAGNSKMIRHEANKVAFRSLRTV